MRFDEMALKGWAGVQHVGKHKKLELRKMYSFVKTILEFKVLVVKQ